MSPDILKFFSEMIEKETGIIFRDSNLYQLKSRLEDIMKNEGLSSPEELYRSFTSVVNLSLRQKLMDHATNNETLFFRDPGFFTAMEDFLIREILPANPSEIKIWSAAASTGQEAISVAITLEELSRKRYLPPFSIVATDISEKALAKGKAGLYSDFDVMRGLTDERKAKYFNKTSSGWQINSQIHSKIKFGINNLTRSCVQGPFHIILCRNVLIYQKVECKKDVVKSLFHQLDPKGGLILGVGETLLGVLDEVDSTMVGSVSFYKPKKINKIQAA